jgi:sterol desaturase/sphingolipid hydroxylase (fatty acid hydroxylase superfamily)
MWHIQDASSEFTLTKRGYYADFFVTPIAIAIALVWLVTTQGFRPEYLASAALAGIVLWTFIEYAVHRWVFHGPTWLNSQHTVHHIQPSEYIGASSTVTGFFFAISLWLLTSVLGACLGVGVFVGLLIGYLAYIVIHDRFHHGQLRKGSVLAKLNSNHDFHHRHAKANFGVTTPLWDIILGTYQAR